MLLHSWRRTFLLRAQGWIHVWSELALPPFWQINHANSTYFRLFLGYFGVISATRPPPPLLDLGPPFYISWIRPWEPNINWGLYCTFHCDMSNGWLLHSLVIYFCKNLMQCSIKMLPHFRNITTFVLNYLSLHKTFD